MYLALTFEILKYLLPAIVLYFIANLLVKAYLKNEELKREDSIKSGNRQIVLPLRLQAYERLILLLERISPQQVIARTLHPGMAGMQYQMLLTQNIREEFEHNVAQQVYVSSQSWAMIKTAKEEMIRLINTVSAETDSKATGNDLAMLILEKSSEWEINPIQAAIEQLKTEAGKLF